MSRSGAFKASKFLTGRRHLILTFHRVRKKESDHDPFDACPSVDADLFRQILIHVKQRYHIVSLRDLCNNVNSLQPLVALAFDDGWRDNYDLAFPILGEMEIPATIFITTGKIGSAEPFWQQRLGNCFRIYSKKDRAKQDQFKREIGLDIAEPLNNITCLKTVEKLKKADLPGLRERLISSSLLNAAPDKERIFLSSEEIREMSRHSIEYGSHTVNHLILTRESDRVVESELRESKETLEKIIGKKIDMIAYPNGDTSKKIIDRADSLGYRIGCTTRRACAGIKDDLMKLPRIDPDWDQMRDEQGGFSEDLFQWGIR